MDQEDKIKWTPTLMALCFINIVMLVLIIAGLIVFAYIFFAKIGHFILG